MVPHLVGTVVAVGPGLDVRLQSAKLLPGWASSAYDGEPKKPRFRNLHHTLQEKW